MSDFFPLGSAPLASQGGSDSFLQGNASLSGTATVAATGSIVVQATASVTGSSTGSAAGKSVIPGELASTGTCSVSVEGSRIVTANATLTSTATVSGNASAIASTDVSIPGTTVISWQGSGIILGNAVLSGTASASYVGHGIASTTVIVSGSSSVSGSGQTVKSGEVSSAGTATVSGVGAFLVKGNTAITGSTVVSGVTKNFISGSLALAGSSTAVAVGKSTRVGDLVAAAGSTVSATGKKTVVANTGFIPPSGSPDWSQAQGVTGGPFFSTGYTVSSYRSVTFAMRGVQVPANPVGLLIEAGATTYGMGLSFDGAGQLVGGAGDGGAVTDSNSNTAFARLSDAKLRGKTVDIYWSIRPTAWGRVKIWAVESATGEFLGSAYGQTTGGAALYGDNWAGSNETGVGTVGSIIRSGLNSSDFNGVMPNGAEAWDQYLSPDFDENETTSAFTTGEGEKVATTTATLLNGSSVSGAGSYRVTATTSIEGSNVVSGVGTSIAEGETQISIIAGQLMAVSGQLSVDVSTINRVPTRVEFGVTMQDPIIVLTGTNDAGQQVGYTLRVSDNDSTGFDLYLAGWEYQTTIPSRVETIYWFAIERGTHTLPDGRVIQAGTVEADETESAVSLAEEMGGQTPIIVTTPRSMRDTTALDSLTVNRSGSGFSVITQVEEARRSLGARQAEEIAYIASTPGSGSVSTSASHNIGSIGFGTSFGSPIVLADQMTVAGPDSQTTMLRSVTASSASAYVAEESSLDVETTHTTELLGIIAFEEGVIGQGGVTGVGSAIAEATVTAVSSTTLTGTGKSIAATEPALTGSSVGSVAGSMIVGSAGSSVCGATVTGSGSAIAEASSSSTGSTTTSFGGKALAAANTNLGGQSTASGKGIAVVEAGSTISGNGSTNGIGSVIVVSAATVGASSSTVGKGKTVKVVEIALTGISQVSAVGIRVLPGVVSSINSASVSGVGKAIVKASGSVAGNAETDFAGKIILPANTDIPGQSVAHAEGALIRTGVTTVAGVSFVAARGIHIYKGLIGIQGAATTTFYQDVGLRRKAFVPNTANIASWVDTTNSAAWIDTTNSAAWFYTENRYGT